MDIDNVRVKQEVEDVQGLDANLVEVKLEVDDDEGSVSNFVTANIISHDSIVRNFLSKLF